MDYFTLPETSVPVLCLYRAHSEWKRGGARLSFAYNGQLPVTGVLISSFHCMYSKCARYRHRHTRCRRSIVVQFLPIACGHVSN